MSVPDVDSGTYWPDELNEALRQADVGIICVTSENREAPYITYEAGALANKGDAGATRVCPYLIDLYLSEEKGGLPPTLSQFACVSADKKSTRKMVKDVCGFLAAKAGLSDANSKAYCGEAEKVVDEKWKEMGAVLAESLGVGRARPGTLKDIIAEDKKLTGDFKRVRALIDAHESSIAETLTPIVRGIVREYRKNRPFNLDEVTQLVYVAIKTNLDEALEKNAFAVDAASMIVGGVRDFFIQQFKPGELHGMLKYEFKPILDDSKSDDAKVAAMLELLFVKKNQVFSRLHRVLAARFAEYLERE
jgi:hypothetical protein